MIEVRWRPKGGAGTAVRIEEEGRDPFAVLAHVEKQMDLKPSGRPLPQEPEGWITLRVVREDDVKPRIEGKVQAIRRGGARTSTSNRNSKPSTKGLF